MPALDPDGNFVPGTSDEEADRGWVNVIAIAAAASATYELHAYSAGIGRRTCRPMTLSDWGLVHGQRARSRRYARPASRRNC
jgi:hypothetical protein